MSCPFTSEGATNVDFATLHFQIINHLQHSHLLCHSFFPVYFLCLFTSCHMQYLTIQFGIGTMFISFFWKSRMLSDAAFTVFIQKTIFFFTIGYMQFRITVFYLNIFEYVIYSCYAQLYFHQPSHSLLCHMRSLKDYSNMLILLKNIHYFH